MKNKNNECSKCGKVFSLGIRAGKDSVLTCGDCVTNSDKATPRPWKIWNDRIWTDEPSDVMKQICTLDGNRGDRDANAKLIVSAVNSHDALLKACNLAKDFIGKLEDAPGNATRVYEFIKEAIKQAEGK